MDVFVETVACSDMWPFIAVPRMLPQPPVFAEKSDIRRWNARIIVFSLLAAAKGVVWELSSGGFQVSSYQSSELLRRGIRKYSVVYCSFIVTRLMFVYSPICNATSCALNFPLLLPGCTHPSELASILQAVMDQPGIARRFEEWSYSQIC